MVNGTKYKNLHGLTPSAIDKWQRDNGFVPVVMVDLLNELDRCIGGIFNTSEGVSISREDVSVERVEGKILELKVVCGNCFF